MQTCLHHAIRDVFDRAGAPERSLKFVLRLCVEDFGERSRALALLNTPQQHKFRRALASTRSTEHAAVVDL